MNFIRKQVRLNTDIYGAFRALSKEDSIYKWNNKSPESIETIPYSKVVWAYTVDGIGRISFEFNLMRCAQKTEYCTEVHLLMRLSDNDQPFVEVFTDILDILMTKLRENFNKDWIIEDGDMLLSIFR